MSPLALPALLPLALTAFNLLTWPRRRAARQPLPTISVLIPARNEAHRIGACLDALRAWGAATEIVVCDDSSTDDTAAIVAAAAARDPRIRCVQGRPLPPGWVGKVNACEVLYHEALGEWLIFMDADVSALPGGLERLAGFLEDAELVTAVPRQATGSWAEDAVLPLLHLTYTSWLPLLLVRYAPWPAFTAANGQVLAARRSALERLGGFAPIRAAVVDDMALCTRAKAEGLRVWFVDGFEIASCRMYRSFGEVWRGFSKNIYPGLGCQPLALLGVLVVYFACFLLPMASWEGLGLLLALRGALALRMGHRARSVLLHPVGVGLLMGIALNSFRWSQRGQIAWSGRTYPARGA